MYHSYLKRFLDFFIALFVLLILSPLMVLVAVLLYLVNNGKVFFTQERPGKNACIFKVIKFKTMNDKKDVYGKLLRDKDRLTPVGKFIRSTSLDELPQLINVLKGDMSLIGPRPLLVRYLPLYNKKQTRRHEVKPGITGWAQVNGRNTINWEEKFELDVWYVDHLSFSLDLKILWLTIKKVIVREGINAGSNVTMPPFSGTAKT
ncbi:sugar transferase [Ferruginibacter paludis]|uniref:sugar transferase n=1 Tax=Ferruginibacter paludis TaxID=1310417 RepID=UPI0025B4873A|nr:sugar transferase [Ferruginibacter paludis]MDN3658881.1 sugar transferase [Ferruginibacter paludis]